MHEYMLIFMYDFQIDTTPTESPDDTTVTIPCKPIIYLTVMVFYFIIEGFQIKSR